MASNFTLPADACAISSFGDAIKKAEALGINITTLALKCPETCDIAYGSGNPDLSGVGVNAAYVTFVGLAVLFAVLRIGSLWSLYEWTKHVRAIQQTFADMAGVFAFSVGVAIAANQQSSLYESIYLGSLCLILWCSASLAILVSLFRGGISDITLKILVINSLYFWGITAILLGALGYNTSHSITTAARQLGPSCKSYKDAGLAIGGSNIGYMPPLIAMCFLLVSCSMGVLFLRYLQSRPSKVQYLLRFKNSIKVGFTVFLCTLSISTIYITVDFQLKRNAMGRVAGARFQDNTWGFGQVIALFVWVPLLLALWREETP
ncbi:MAG: hypothetical protein M1839_008344 [Geoglossum umbratile]|nr:MAG: hypothetical protein M1839_008344 [Geoglossum umbratile]